VITRPARRSRIGTDRIWVSSSLALGNGAATSRTEQRPESRVLRIVGVFRLFLGVEVVEVAEELVETVYGRQVFVAVAEMVLTELAGRVTERLQRLGDGDLLRLQPDCGTGNADLGEAGAQRRLTRDEARPPCGAALLGVAVSEHHPDMVVTGTKRR